MPVKADTITHAGEYPVKGFPDRMLAYCGNYALFSALASEPKKATCPRCIEAITAGIIRDEKGAVIGRGGKLLAKHQPEAKEKRSAQVKARPIRQSTEPPVVYVPKVHYLGGCPKGKIAGSFITSVASRVTCVSCQKLLEKLD